jgi:hypothetical protein
MTGGLVDEGLVAGLLLLVVGGLVAELLAAGGLVARGLVARGLVAGRLVAGGLLLSELLMSGSLLSELLLCPGFTICWLVLCEYMLLLRTD